MKKKSVLIAIICLSLFLIPKPTNAVTLKEYEDQVAKYTAELQAKEAKLAKNDKEIAEVKAKIRDIEIQMAKAEEDIKKLQEEIDESNKKIAKKEKEIEKLVKYFQVVSNENTYLEYIFEATTITDMIYRVSVVEQLTDYNKQVMKELEKLIEENKKKTVELQAKKKELAALEVELQDQKERIEADSAVVRGTIPNTKTAIKQSQARVNYYKSRGCKSNDVIGVDCDKPKPVSSGGYAPAGALVGPNGFRFPVNGGRISWYYGNGHKGVDIVKGCGTPIYAVAGGTVYYVGSTKDNYGAKMVMIVHNYDGRLVFSQYAHLQGYNVSEGQNVTTGTVIGYMGSTGWSTGCHLHLEMSEDYGWDYNSVYTKYTRHIINPFNYVPRP